MIQAYGIRQQAQEVKAWIVANYGTEVEIIPERDLNKHIGLTYPDLLPVQREMIKNCLEPYRLRRERPQIIKLRETG